VPSKKEPAGGNSLPPPPAPPAKLVDLFRIVILGTTVWLVIMVVALFTGPHILAWTGFTGAVLGVIGMLIMTWQRAAVRRGSKTAQQGL
jgi:Flp pilus assembly protein TadB